MASAAKAKLGALYLNAKEAVYLCTRNRKHQFKQTTQRRKE
jgi:hypothetical protein